MRFQRHLKPFTGRLDLAPFAGVFFLLVLFLLLQSQLAPLPGLRINLPMLEGTNVMTGPGASLVLTVDRNELVYFDHQVIGDTDLRDRLQGKVKLSREPLTLLIQADETVKHAAIVRVAGLARQAGVSEVIIGTRPSLFPIGTAVTNRP